MHCYKSVVGGFRCMWRYCKALCNVKFSQIEGNGQKFSHIERSNGVIMVGFLTVWAENNVSPVSHTRVTGIAALQNTRLQNRKYSQRLKAFTKPGVWPSDMRIPLNYYTDPDPGSRNSLYRSKEKKISFHFSPKIRVKKMFIHIYAYIYSTVI